MEAENEREMGAEMNAEYQAFLENKAQLADGDGFEPSFMPDSLFDFQSALVTWAIRQGAQRDFC